MNRPEHIHHVEILTEQLAQQAPLLVDKLIGKGIAPNTDKARLCLREVLRFLYLCANTQNILTPSQSVDEVWHEFILFTRDYERFCREQFQQFIHHQPSAQPILEQNQYRHTLILYRQHYGTPEPHFWGDAGICDSHCGACENAVR